MILFPDSRSARRRFNARRILFPSILMVSALVLATAGFVQAKPASTRTDLPDSTITNGSWNVLRFVIDVHPPLPTNSFPEVFQKYTATNVSLDDIAEAAGELQARYRALGHPTTIIAIGRDDIADGSVIMHVAEGAVPQILVAGQRYLPPLKGVEVAKTSAASSTNTVAPVSQEKPVPASPKYFVGSPVPAPLMAELNAALTNEIATVNRRERRALLLPETGMKQAASTNGPFFEIKGYQVTGNTLLSTDLLDIVFEPFVGTNVTFDAIRGALGDLQRVYRESGFPTVSVALPQQKLTNGIVAINVFEGRVSEVLVVGNRYFSSNNVMRALPGLRAGEILYGPTFQSELDRANANQDRQIYPQIEPGVEENTTSLKLKVVDQLPLHGKIELNNQNTPGTPDLRVNSSIAYNNLWNLEHSMGLQYGFSPEKYKSGNDWEFYDQPLVANYSAFYRLPIGGFDAPGDNAATPGSFGYDEATRKFKLPPPSGRPELNVYASRSTSDTGSISTPRETVFDVGTNALYKQDIQQDLTENNSVGARLTIPLPEGNHAFSFGPDFKTYDLLSHKTNLLTLKEVTDLPDGGQVTTISQVPVASTNHNYIEYLPVSLRYDTSWRNGNGVTTFGVGMSVNAWFSGSISNLQNITGSTKSEGHWIVLTPSFSREFNFRTNWTMSIRADAQWASEPLISNEQFGLGGVANVRGYSEGEVFGDDGWRVNLDLKTPPHVVGAVYGQEMLTVRAGWFMDYAESYLIDPLGRDRRTPLWGTGIGTVFAVGTHWDAKLLFSLPLLDAGSTSAYQPKFSFSVTGQF